MEKHPTIEIWVYGDLRNERFFGISLNILAKARELAQSVSGKVAMVLLVHQGLMIQKLHWVRERASPLVMRQIRAFPMVQI